MISDGQTSNEARLALANAQANYAEILSEIGAENDCIDAYRRPLTTRLISGTEELRNDLSRLIGLAAIDLGSVLQVDGEHHSRRSRSVLSGSRLVSSRIE